MSFHDHGGDETAGASGKATAESSTRNLGFVAGINFVGFLVELAGGVLFGSVALLSDALHMLFDTLAYLMAFGASYTADRFQGGDQLTYGLHRLEPIAAFLNGVLLLPMVGYILWESYRRVLDPVSINPELTLIIAGGGLGINIWSVFIVQGGEMSLNERGAFYHLLGDAGGSVAVIISTIAIALFDLRVADPIAAVGIGLLILWSAGKLLSESALIFLQGSPIGLDALRGELVAIDGVERIDDLHVWQVCSQLTVGSVQLSDTATSLDEQRRIRKRAHSIFNSHGVDHSTVECTGSAETDEGRPESWSHDH